jgi:acetaldehyde dehydrogenase (acetylating)
MVGIDPAYDRPARAVCLSARTTWDGVEEGELAWMPRRAELRSVGTRCCHTDARAPGWTAAPSGGRV